MSELRDAGVPELTDLSLRGVIAWVLEVLGISMEKIWEKLAAHPRIGPERVARIRGMISTLEGIWTFIRDVQERGMAAIWDKIQEQLSNLWNTILDAVKNWVMEQIVNRIVTRLLSMLDPTGIMAVVNSAIAIYSAIQSFIKYMREMLEIVNSFVNGVADIAEGNVTTAANYLERTMARAMPVAIGFLANQVGLSGIGRRVGEMIERAREMVDQALTWLVNRAVDTGMNLIDRLMGRGGASTTSSADTRAQTGEESLEERYGAEKAGRIRAGLQAIETAEQPLLNAGTITQEQAQQVAENVKRDHHVFTTLEVIDGDTKWNYRYTASAPTLVSGPNKNQNTVANPAIPNLCSLGQSLSDMFENTGNNKKYIKNKAGGFIGIVLKSPVNGTSVITANAAMYSGGGGATAMANAIQGQLPSVNLRRPPAIHYGGSSNAYHTEKIVLAVSKAIFAVNNTKIDRIISSVCSMLTPCTSCAPLTSTYGTSLGANGSFTITSGNLQGGILFDQSAPPYDGNSGLLISSGHVNYQPASTLYGSAADKAWITSFKV
jgi:hypothetical protein